MKPLSFVTVLLLLNLISNAQSNNFKISGSTSVDIRDVIFLIVNTDTLQTHVVNKEFVFEGHIDGPTRVTLKSGKNCGSQFFIDPSEMQLITTTSQVNSTCIFKDHLMGSPTQVLYEEYLAGVKEIIEKSKGITQLDKVKNYANEFISKHPSSIVASYIIQTNSRNFGYVWTKRAFEYLSEDQKKSLQGLDIQKILIQHDLLKIGNSIINFSQNDIHDSIFRLSSLKGTYVLIDFWASWCGPCRKENPNLKKVYEKYHSKGFEIVGISLDNDANKWKQAVEKDGLPWIHISDLKGWNNEIATGFEINAIPTNILIDKEGKIIATNLRGIELERAVKKCFNNTD